MPLYVVALFSFPVIPESNHKNRAKEIIYITGTRIYRPQILLFQQVGSLITNLHRHTLSLRLLAIAAAIAGVARTCEVVVVAALVPLQCSARNSTSGDYNFY